MALRGETVGVAYVRIVALGDGLDKSIAEAVRESADDVEVERASEDVGHTVDEHIGKGIEDSNDSDTSIERKVTGWTTLFKRLRPAVADVFDGVDRDNVGIFTRMSNAIRNFEIDADRFGDEIGLLFGRGSRNDFINFSGAFIGNSTKGILGMLNGVKKFIQFLPNAKGVLTDFLAKNDLAKNGLLDLSGEFEGITTKLTDFATKAGPIAAGIAVALFAVLGPLAGLISGLAAALTALAASVAFALGAGLGVLVGLLPPLAAGVGAVILAVQGLDKKQIAGFFSEFKNQIKGLQKALGQDLTDAIDALLPGIRSAFDGLAPILRKAGSTLDGFAAHISEVFSGNTFASFTATLSENVKPILKNIEDIVANLLDVILGLFNASIPLAREFTRWLSRIVENFADWVNSRRGQKALTDFLDRAADSAKSVGRFIRDVVVAIGLLLDAGKGTGDNIFDDLSQQFEDFIKFIHDNPDTISQWFADGEKVARAVGRAIKGVIDLFAALDTPENRKAAVAILDAVTAIVEGVAGFIGFIEDKFGPFISLWADELETIAKAFQKLWDFLFGHSIIPDMIDGFKAFFKFLKGGWDFIKGIVTTVTGWFSDLAHNVKEKLDDVIGFFKDLPGKIGDALSTAKDKIGDFVSGARDRFSDFVSTVKDKIGDAASFIREKISEIPGIISGFADRFFNAAKTLGSNILDGLKAGVEGAVSVASDIASGIRDAIVGMINSLIDQLNSGIPDSINVPGPLPNIDLPDNPFPHVFGKGGIVDDPTNAIVGDRGIEAIVPLAIPLSQVDPSVRELARIARGLPTPGRGVDVGGITIITPTEDPAAVATETVNRLVASSYFG